MCHLAIPAVIGTGLQLAGNMMQSQDVGDSAREEAKNMAARGAREADLVRRDNQRAAAKHRVAMLKGGVTTAGSPTDSLLDLTQEGERTAYWTQLGYDQEAREKQRAARRARRNGVLDSLTSVNTLGSDLMKLKESGGFKWIWD